MEHDRSPLAAYVIGALDPEEARDLDMHLSGCAECQAELAELSALEEALGEVPPEAFLDGPPDADLMLQRTLRQVRAERGQLNRPRRLLMAAGVAGLVAAALAGGTLLGRDTAPKQQAGPAQPPVMVSPSVIPSVIPSGTRTITGKNPRTGASMTAVVVPAAGWVRVHAKVDGVRAGLRCRLVVVPKSGAPIDAGSWLVSPLGEKQGTALDGSALVAPADIASVDVVTFEGQKLVSVPV